MKDAIAVKTEDNILKQLDGEIKLTGHDSLIKTVEDSRILLVNCFLKVTYSLICAGTGIDGVYFKQNEIDVICIDISKESVKKCIERGLDARVMDFYDLSFSDKSFQVVYALNCLLHVPKKDIAQVLQEIKGY